jgi:hypothetical protein
MKNNYFFRDEITAGAEVLMEKIKMYRPKIVAFNGRGLNIYKTFKIIIFFFRNL